MISVGDMLKRILKVAPAGTKAADLCRDHGGKGDAAGCLLCIGRADTEMHQRIMADSMAEIEARNGLARKRSACIPPRFDECGFDDYDADGDGQTAALSVCRDYAEQFPGYAKRGSGLLLLGWPGTGKTHLACAIAMTIVDQHGASARG